MLTRTVSVLGVLFGALGLGISNLGIYFSMLVNRVSFGHTASRVVPCIILVLIAFFAALARSKYPRLVIASRIIQFHSAWTLTSNLRSITVSIKFFSFHYILILYFQDVIEDIFGFMVANFVWLNDPTDSLYYLFSCQCQTEVFKAGNTGIRRCGRNFKSYIEGSVYDR